MHSREFWELSKELMRRTEEACHRTAVSRAYYAAFHRTRDFLTLLGFRTRQSDQAHAGLYRRLSCTHREELDEAARSLMNLRGLRNSADYELTPAFAKSAVVQAAECVREIFERLDLPRDAAELDSISDTIRTYERDVLREITWQKP